MIEIKKKIVKSQSIVDTYYMYVFPHSLQKGSSTAAGTTAAGATAAGASAAGATGSGTEIPDAELIATIPTATSTTNQVYQWYLEKF